MKAGEKGENKEERTSEGETSAATVDRLAKAALGEKKKGGKERKGKETGRERAATEYVWCRWSSQANGKSNQNNVRG